MSHKRIRIADDGTVTIVTFIDKKILEAASIQELGDELFGLIAGGVEKLVLDFDGVEFLSSAALNKLIILDKKVKAGSGDMVLCNLRQEIHEVFVITRLNQLFVIEDTVDEAVEKVLD